MGEDALISAQIGTRSKALLDRNEKALTPFSRPFFFCPSPVLDDRSVRPSIPQGTHHRPSVNSRPSRTGAAAAADELSRTAHTSALVVDNASHAAQRRELQPGPRAAQPLRVGAGRRPGRLLTAVLLPALPRLPRRGGRWCLTVGRLTVPVRPARRPAAAAATAVLPGGRTAI